MDAVFLCFVFYKLVVLERGRGGKGKKYNVITWNIILLFKIN